MKRVECAVCSVQCTVYRVQCAVCSVQYLDQLMLPLQEARLLPLVELLDLQGGELLGQPSHLRGVRLGADGGSVL